MLDNLDSVYQEFKDLVKTVADGKRLDEIRVKFLGKNGLITNEAKKIGEKKCSIFPPNPPRLVPHIPALRTDTETHAKASTIMLIRNAH